MVSTTGSRCHTGMVSKLRRVDVNGVPTTEELMSLLNGVSITGDLTTQSDGVPGMGS